MQYILHHPRDEWCQKNLNANDRPAFDGGSTESCEGFFSWLSKYGPALRHSSSARFGVWTLIICHLRNIFTVNKDFSSSQGGKRKLSGTKPRAVPPFKDYAPDYYIYTHNKSPFYMLVKESMVGARKVPTSFPANLMLTVSIVSYRLNTHRRLFFRDRIGKDSSSRRREVYRMVGRQILVEECLLFSETFETRTQIMKELKKQDWGLRQTPAGTNV
jgi:hypothetical protein